MNAMRLLTAALLVAVASPASAADTPSVTAWARATPGGSDAGSLYLTLHGGAAADAVTGLSTPAAGMAMLHESTTENGVAKMRDLDSLPVPAHATVAMQPGGVHVMLMALAHPLRRGDRFPVTVTFRNAAPVTVTATVAGIGATAP